MKRSETTPFTVQEASGADATAILALADVHREELGALMQHRAWLIRQIDMGEVFVAKTAEDKLVGFISFHHNPLPEHEHTTIHYLCTASDYRRQGIGKLLMEAVASDARLCGKRTITLRCPSHLGANHFYKSIGYTLEGSETDQEDGHLNVWTLSL
jgi:ribosomal protein S18 acetylase RimI-like enzyme